MVPQMDPSGNKLSCPKPQFCHLSTFLELLPFSVLFSIPSYLCIMDLVPSETVAP